MSEDFTAFYAQRQAESPEATEDPLILSQGDGKGILMRVEDLREATCKAAQRTRHKLKSPLSAREKRNRKRMALVAAVYSVAAQVAQPRGHHEPGATRGAAHPLPGAQ